MSNPKQTNDKPEQKKDQASEQKNDRTGEKSELSESELQKVSGGRMPAKPKELR